MKLRMLVDARASIDGVHAVNYKKEHVYNSPDEMLEMVALAWLQRGLAKLENDVGLEKKVVIPAETKKNTLQKITTNCKRKRN